MEEMQTIIVQFLTTQGLGTMEELDLRHKIEGYLNEALIKAKMGWCDGGQMGCGSAEIFLFVNEVSAAVIDVIKEVCSKSIDGYTIAHHDEVQNKIITIYPDEEVGIPFSMTEHDARNMGRA